VLRDLVAWGDVLTESFSPGVVERLGFGYEAVRALNPRIIMISSCLLGQSGPWRDYAGFGNLAAAVSGFHALTGRPGAPPTGCFGPYTDFIGVRYNALAILAALMHRERTGEGQYIDMAQAEAAVHFLGREAVDYLNAGTIPRAVGNRDPDMAPHGVYRCAGTDRWVAIAARDDAEWRSLCAAAGLADLAADPSLATLAGRMSAEDRIDARISAWTAQETPLAVEQRLQACGVAAHAVLDTHELEHDPMLRHRGHFLRVAHPLHGEAVIESSRVLYSRTKPAIPDAVPTYGSGREAVLRDLLGYDDARIEALLREGALR
jgi:crotonobetainyl-CoA:carnitine CoA-transferase CaiB-like acyl-CoA transferase